MTRQFRELLADYAADIGNDPLVVTSHGQPVAALVPIQNADMETVALSTNREFLELIERSRARVRAEGGISSAEMRRRFGQCCVWGVPGVFL